MAKLFRFKSIKKGNFTAIDLTTVEDRSLSWKAKGIHLYLMSRPPEWTVRATDLIRRSKDGRDSLYNGLKELVDKKYIHRKRVYENGKVIYWSYEIYEEPTEEPLPENLHPGNPEIENLLPGNLEIENPEILINNTINNKHKDKTGSNEPVAGFSRNTVEDKVLVLKIKKLNGSGSKKNGFLFDSNSKKRRTVGLNSWNQHSLKKGDIYEKSILALQNKIRRIKRPLGAETKEVLDYWNDIASQLSNNGHKLPSHRLDIDTKTSYMCKIIVTGLLHTSGLTVDDIKKAIDNYVKILEDSHYYNHIYTFPQFYGKQELFTNCVEGSLGRYIKQRPKSLIKGLIAYHQKVNYGKKPSDLELNQYNDWIKTGFIASEDDFYKIEP